MRLILFLATLITTLSNFSLAVQAESTIGLIHYSENAYQGYTLFSGLSSGKSYLINNCGEVVNSWESSVPYYTAYLTEEGNLIKIVYGQIQMYDWDNNLIWSYQPPPEYSDIHSDIIIMPNGNIIVPVEQYLTPIEWITAGGDPSTFGNYGAYEILIEIEPTGPDTGEIVWTWSIFDRAIQDFDSTKANYGIVADHPERFDINMGSSLPDFSFFWTHFNGIDYNPDLDQIMISCWFASEVYIIDHSTTTAEAAGHTGGIYGKGGDFLWRWGNVENYNVGTAEDREFYGQHNARWIKPGYPNEGMITVHENGNGRPDGAYSRAVLMSTEVDENGNYQLDSNNKFLPDNIVWDWDGDVNGETYYTQYMGSVNYQPNGNFLVCEAVGSRFFEVTPNGEIVWIYYNPEFFTQGDDYCCQDTYNIVRYSFDYPAFDDREIIATNIIEDFNDVSNVCPAILPVANFQFQLDMGGLPIEVNFTDISENDPTEWLWDFGDGFASNENYEQNPSHVFLEAQAYEVCLIATNVIGADTICQTLDLTILNTNEDLNSPNQITWQQINDQLIINSEEKFTTLSVFDLNGRRVLQSNLKINQSINISNIKKGIYVALLSKKGDKQASTIRFVKH